MNKQNEIRQQITDRIVAALKAGTPPWRRPWSALENTGSPANAASGKAYRGVNALLLGLAGYESRWWATYAQVQALGGRVKRGERSTRIVFWRQVEKARATRDDHELVETFPLLKTYCVFNAAQTEGLEEYLARPRTTTAFVDFEPAETVITATDARIEYGGSRAAYILDDDIIRLPPRDAFESQREFYATAFHELIHHSGHPSRLDRLKRHARFGSEAYGYEELVGEMGGAFLCNEVGVPQSAKLDNHAAYLASWLGVLQSDATAIFTAASQASAAVEYILSFSRKGEGAGEECEAAMDGLFEQEARS